MDCLTSTSDVLDFIRVDGIQKWYENITNILESRMARRNANLAFHCWMAGIIESVNEGWLCDKAILESEEGILEWSKLFLRSFKTRNQMFIYTRSVLMQYCAMDMEIAGIPDKVGDKDSERADAQTFLSSVSRAVSILPRKFGQWIAEGAISACDDVWQKVKKLFFSVLGGYSALVLKWCDWIESFWDQLRDKAAEFYNSAMQSLRGFEEAFYWGLSLIATVCLVSCIEKFLVVMGLLAQPINLVAMLVPAFMAAFCITYSSGYLCEKLEELNRIHAFFCGDFLTSIPPHLFPGFFKEEREKNDRARKPNHSQAQFAPINLLESFASMLGNFNSKSFVELGRVANAFNSVHTAFGGIQALSTKIITGLWKVMDSAFGIQSQALATLSVTLGCDIEGWLKECDAMEEYFVQFGKVDAGMLKRVRKLCCKGRKIQAVLMQEGRGVAPAIASVVFKSLERLQLVQKQMALRGVVSARKMPFVVAFVGASRTGKSIVARKFAEDLCEYEGLDVDQIYSRQGTDPFWSGYRREFVTMYDDFAAVPNSACKSDEIELMPLVSLEPVALNMASLEEKGNIFFESEAIIYSSNFLDASPRSEIQDVNAFRNRRHVLIEVERNTDDGRVYNGFNTTDCQRYSILHPVTMHKIISFDSYEELWVFLVNKWNDHGVEQTANLATFRKTKNTLKAPMRSLLEIIRPGELGIPEDLLIILRQKECTYITNIGKRVFAVQEGGVFIDMEYGGDGKLPECGGMERVVQTVETMHHIGTLNPLVVHYLGVLVRKRWLKEDLTWNVEVQELDEYIKEVVDELEPTHKALLYCLQYHFATDSKENRWYMKLWTTMKDTMATIFYKEVKDWPVPLKIVVGGALVVALGATFWTAVRYLVNMSGSAAFGSAGSAVFVATAQSRQPNRNESTEYRMRNVPAKARKWNYSIPKPSGGTENLRGEHWADMDDSVDYDAILRSWGQASLLNSENQYLMNKLHANLEVGSQSYQIMLLPGKRILLCNHYVNSWKSKGSSFYCNIVLNSGRNYMHLFQMSAVKEIEGSELSVYSSKSLEDVPHSLWNNLCQDVEAKCGKNVNALMMTLKMDPFTNNLEYTYAPIAVRVRTRTLSIDGIDYVREIPTCLEYKVPTVNTDCGSLIMTCIQKKWQIIGVHVAGSEGWGFANLIPSELEPPTEELIFSAQAQHFPEHYFEFYSEEAVKSNSLSCVAQCKPTSYIRMPKATALVRTPDEWHLGTQVVKEPSILVSDDPRLGSMVGQYDPFSKGMEKYAQQMRNLEDGILEEVVLEMGEQWHDCVDENDSFGDVSVETALNGIEGVEYFDSLVLGTSEGFPHCLERNHGEKGKSRFVQGEIGHLSLVPGTSVEKAYNHLKEVVKKEVPTLYGIECPKDELLPLRKIYDTPKTRLFTVLPMEYNILVRQQFLNFVRFTMRHRRDLACKVGTNPYSREWNHLAMNLLEKGNKILCCDYSSFDGLCSKQMMGAILKVVQRVTGEKGESWNAKCNTLMAACSRYAIAQARVWKVEGGIPSGIPLTVILNSMMNEILVRYYFKKRFLNEPILRNSFKNFISLAVYGDDNLISVHPACSEVFNGKYLQEEMAKDNIKITDGVDKTLPTLAFRELEHCDFLKRKFVLNKSGLFVGPLEKSSLWGQLHYVREKGSEMIEAYLTNAENVCRELYLHNKAESGLFRKKVLALGIFNPQQFPTMAQINAFFEEQMGNRSGNFNLSVDLMLNPELLGTLSVVNDPGFQHLHSLVPNVQYGAWTSYKQKDGDCMILCGLQGEENENQIVVKFPYGIGRGGLPTAQWLREHYMRENSNLKKKILNQYRSGRNLVFLSANGNVISMVMATMFCFGASIIDVGLSNVAVTAAIEKCKALGFLSRDMPELFVSSKSLMEKAKIQKQESVFVVTTTNKGKIEHYKQQNPNLKMKFVKVETTEIQGSLREIVAYKEKEVLRDPKICQEKQDFGIIVVEDCQLDVDNSGFPGPYVKFVPESWYLTMDGKSAIFTIGMSINGRYSERNVCGSIKYNHDPHPDAFGFDKHFMCSNGESLRVFRNNVDCALRKINVVA